jgi:hypothetical protein
VKKIGKREKEETATRTIMMVSTWQHDGNTRGIDCLVVLRHCIGITVLLLGDVGFTSCGTEALVAKTVAIL